MMRLFTHQAEQLEFFRGRARGLSLLPYGAGKTLPTILRMRDLCPPQRALVVTTASLVSKWAHDLRRFGDREWEVVSLQGSAKQRLAEFARPHNVAVTNYEAVGVLERPIEDCYAVIVLDEVHRLRNPKSKVSQGWARVTQDVDYVYGLTGSPVLESPADLFGILRAVNHTVFGTDLTVFLNTFCKPIKGAKRPGRWRLRRGAMVELTGALHAMSFHRDRGHLDQRMPAQAEAAPLVFDLHPSVRRFYKRLEKDARRVVHLRGIAPQRAAARLEKLAQAARGWIYDDQALRRLGPNRARIKLSEFLEGIRNTGPVVIWAPRRPDLDDVAAALGSMGLSHVVIDGQVPVRRRDLAMSAFNGGDLDALVAHPRCLGEAALSVSRSATTTSCSSRTS